MIPLPHIRLSAQLAVSETSLISSDTGSITMVQMTETDKPQVIIDKEVDSSSSLVQNCITEDNDDYPEDPAMAISEEESSMLTSIVEEMGSGYSLDETELANTRFPHTRSKNFGPRSNGVVALEGNDCADHNKMSIISMNKQLIINGDAL